jgi:asparagine synthase (glutamine-hydrolysing)
MTGFWQHKETYEEILTSEIMRMSETLAHRGSDDTGVYIDGKNGIALGHRRPSILDATSLGHQPMESASGRYLIVYNGEIYNFWEIRSKLDGRNIQWRGHSDTEVLLAAIDVWGLEAAVRRSNGMFAFVLWDRKTGFIVVP